MKKKILIGLSLLLFSTSLVGCNNGSDISPETLALTRQFVSSMKKDVNDFNNLIYQSSFSQKYSVNYVSETENETTNYSLDYHAEGEATSGYYFGVNGTSEVTPAKIYNYGTGYFAGKQQEVVKLSHVDTAKNDKGKAKNSKADYTLKHAFGIQFDQNKLYALGNNELTNKLVSNTPVTESFAGSIDRKDADGKPVISGFAEQVVETAINRILFLQSWTTIAKFKEAVTNYFQGLDISKDEDAKQFIKDKQIQINETEEFIKVNFVLDGNKVLKELTGQDLGVVANINGSAEINKATKFTSAMRYEFKELLFATLSKGNVDKKSFDITVDNYSLSTILLSTPVTQMKLEGTFTPYSTADKMAFVDNFNKYVVPSLEEVEVDNK